MRILLVLLAFTILCGCTQKDTTDPGGVVISLEPVESEEPEEPVEQEEPELPLPPQRVLVYFTGDRCSAALDNDTNTLVKGSNPNAPIEIFHESVRVPKKALNRLVADGLIDNWVFVKPPKENCEAETRHTQAEWDAWVEKTKAVFKEENIRLQDNLGLVGFSAGAAAVPHVAEALAEDEYSITFMLMIDGGHSCAAHRAIVDEWRRHDVDYSLWLANICEADAIENGTFEKMLRIPKIATFVLRAEDNTKYLRALTNTFVENKKEWDDYKELGRLVLIPTEGDHADAPKKALAFLSNSLPR